MISRIPPPASTNRVVLILVIACLFVTFTSAVLVTAQKDEDNFLPSANPPTSTSNTATRTRIAENFGRLPLSFEVNKGQTDQSVKFLSHGAGYDLFLTSTEAVLRVQKPRELKSNKETAQKPDDANVREGTVLRLKMLGANTAPVAEGQDELPGKVNYFIGNDPTNWRRNIPTYKKAYFRNVYPGIDVVYYGNQRELEYDFVVAPGASPKLIRFTVEGADQTRLDKTGNLKLTLKHGEVFLHKPVIYQLDKNGARREIKGAYVITGNEVRFKLEQFDSSKPLVIDPVLSYSTLLGAGSNDSALGIAVDSQGSAYVTGNTDGTTFPTTPGSFKSISTRNGAFVSKLDPTGSTLVYSTYLSGEGTTNGLGIAVDAAGNAHVTGSTSAIDFPIVNGLKTSSNFFRTTNAAANWNNQNSGITGSVNAIGVAPGAPNTIYAAAGDGIFRSTDAGATWTKTPATGLSSFNFANVITVDPTNAATVYLGHFFGLFKSVDSGNTWTPVNSAPLNNPSVFAIAFDPATPATIYLGTSAGVFKSTNSGASWFTQNNFGVAGTPNVHALAIDPTAPLTIYAGTFGNGLFKSINGGGVWTAMNNGMGGGNPTLVNAIAIDPVTPSTVYTGHGSSPSGGGINKSTDGGASWTPLANVPNAGINAMVATSSSIYAAVNSAGIIKTTNGGTNWTNTATGLWSPAVLSLAKHPTDPSVLYAGTIGSGFSDAFITKLNASGSGLLFSTFLGGSKEETGNAIAVDGSGNIHVAGQTTSLNFPFVNAVRSTVTFNGNCGTGFVTKLNPAAPSYTFSTYLGGGECDVANSLALDSSGNVYVTGRTSSPDFPTANAFQPNLAGQPNSDAFVTKFTPAGAFIYSTYLGGANGADTGFGIAADSSGNAYVTGITSSTNFPTMNPIQTSGSGFVDGFVTKFNSQGSALVYSTYLGGSGSDSGRGIAVDSANNAYVVGSTDSLNFPVLPGALRTRSVMFKSTDGSANWSNDNYDFGGAVGSPISGTPSINGLVINPIEPSTIYTGSGQGVFKSINGGRTWSAMNNGLTSRAVIAIVISPSTPATLYVLVSDLTNNSGVYKTTDGGATWVRRSNGLLGTELNSLVIDPITPNTLYVGVGCCVAGSRLFKTTDGGDNWAPVANAPAAVPAVLAVDPLNHLTIYAADAATPGGVHKSLDGGATWQTLGPAVTFARSIAVSPHTAGVLYAGTDQGVFKSTDGGSSWTQFFPRAGKVVLDPVSSTTLYLVTHPFSSNSEGLLKSTNNGQTFTPMNKGLNTPQIVALAINPLRPSILHLATISAIGQDAFVTKINPAGNAFVYSTFLGGPVSPEHSFSNLQSQAFAVALDAAGNAYVTGSTLSQFLVTPGSYQHFNRGSNDAFISKLSTSHIISGRVLNNGVTPLGGAEVVLNDSGSLTSVLTENDGSYQFSRLRQGGNYTVSASLPHFTMTPASQTFNNLNSDQVLNFSALTSDSPFFQVSGQITENGVPLAGATVTLSGSQSGLRTTDTNGNFSFDLIINGNYTITPSLVGFNFGPTSRTFNNLIANQTANFTATRQNFVVTNANNHGAGSLREAIINANATLGADTIVFNIPGAGVKIINLLTALPEITDRVTIDATTQPGYAGTPLIELEGTALGSGGHGLVIKAGSSTIRGLSIGNFRTGNAILVNACDNNLIQANYLGVAADGTTGRQNARGVTLTNSSNNVIGGTTAATRNLISASTGAAIDISGNSNLVQGNFIGTNAAGTAAIPNVGGVSILSTSATDNLIGGTTAGAGNLISGNTNRAISTLGPGTVIQGNLIGTDVTGTKKIPNSIGVQAVGTNILVGGLTAAARNVISGNQSDGVELRGAGTRLQGNYIGTDITGSLALGNIGNGVIAGENVLVGGTVPEARNIIAANGGFGNVALGFNNTGSPATVQGNYIGTDVTGTRALADFSNGIQISTSNNVIGGLVAGARNVISGNSAGIVISGFSGTPQGNLIQGNFIGLNAAGTAPVPNTNHGITISNGLNNTIGGTQSGAGNKIAFNGGTGVSINNGTGNAIRSNSIFSNNGLGIDLGANGVTANDASDGDTGPNLFQNFPVITGAMSTSNSTTIQGSLKSTPNTTFQIDFYSNSSVDPSGHGEGAQFFNTTSVNTDGNGDATINVTFPIGLAAGRVITATAIDPSGNTSEFSAADATATLGSVQFSVSAIRVIEDVGTITINAVRTGGATGSLSVDYATVNGTAIAGQDYTSTSGTLTFTGTETSKTIQLQILDDATTETDETFTVQLRNNTNIEVIGAPAVLTVTVQDRSIPPSLTVNNLSLLEGNAGATTQAEFSVILSAATGRSVTGTFITNNAGASGGTTCGTPGVDYEAASSTFSVTPGTTSTTIPIKICGDNNAEANESFRVLIVNVTGASSLVFQVTGTIVNDDILELSLEESGPVPGQAAALDAILAVRDPFRITGIPDWFPSADKNTRVVFLARGLELNPGELSSAVAVRFTDSIGAIFEVPAESVRPIPNTEFTQVVARLPNNLASGTCTVFIRAHTHVSNTGTIRIIP